MQYCRKLAKGGEKIKLHRLRPSKHLKHLYQAAKIASFERERLPLVWLDDSLIFAAGLGCDVREYADRVLVPERVRLVWVPDAPLISALKVPGIALRKKVFSVFLF